MCGRAVSSPHRQRTDEDREFARDRVPTISLDHCFLGTAEDDESAHSSPFLVLFDGDTEAIYAIAVADKTAKPWVVEYVHNVLVELGYGGVKVAIKVDGAKDLHELRRLVTARRTAPTVPLDVPTRESKGNGAVERAVRTWEGQFRTLKSQLEHEIGEVLPKRHPILQWCAWWAASVLNRVAVKTHGRTVYEYITGHRMKTPISCFGEAVLWRRRRSAGNLNKHDSEWADGVYLGVSGLSTGALIGTANGVVRTADFRMSTEGRWNKKLIDDMQTSFEEYVNPSVVEAEPVVIHAFARDHGVLPGDLEPVIGMRRMKLAATDFELHGYTAGCSGCIHLQRGAGTARGHTEACRTRMEKCLIETEQGRARKEREVARREEQLTEEITREEQAANRKTEEPAVEPTVEPATSETLRRRQEGQSRMSDRLRDAAKIARSSAPEVPSVGVPRDQAMSEGEISENGDKADTSMQDHESVEELRSGPTTVKDTLDENCYTFGDLGEMETEEEAVVLDDGPTRTTDRRVEVEARAAASPRFHTPGTPENPEVKRHRPTTEARRDLDNRDDAVTRSLELGSPNTTPVNQDEKRPKLCSLDEHFLQMDVYPDSVGKQLQSCVANGKLFDTEEMRVLTSMVNGADITEIFSPERVTRMCNKYGLIAGSSYDLRDGYDLSDEKVQSKVLREINAQRPRLVIGSPPCTWFSRLMQLNIHVQGPEWYEKFKIEKAKARKHIQFCIRLFLLQRARGDYFLFEHPAYADSWGLEEVVRMGELEGVSTVVADQCMYGLTTPGPDRRTEMPAKKPTRFMSNSWCELQELFIRCDKSHEHQHLIGGRGARAAEYPDLLCEAICRGLANQNRFDSSGKVCTGPSGIGALRSFIGIVSEQTDVERGKFPDHWVDKKHEPDGTAHNHIVIEGNDSYDRLGQFYTGENIGAEKLSGELSALAGKELSEFECYDDVTGAHLKEEMVRKARAVEMEFFSNRGGWSELISKARLKREEPKSSRGGGSTLTKATPQSPITVRGLWGKNLTQELIPHCMRRRRPWRHSSYCSATPRAMRASSHMSCSQT